MSGVEAPGSTFELGGGIMNLFNDPIKEGYYVHSRRDS